MNELESTISFHKGDSPLVVSVPHAGTLIPSELRERMLPDVLFLPDTDWFVDKLYDWVPEFGASLVVTPWSRYVIDLNRPSDNAPLYADSAGSSLVPVRTFAGDDIYREGEIPDQGEVEQRLEHFWHPYHQRLQGLIEAARKKHGYAVLLDGHSIRSTVPELFAGELPHLNLGTNGGVSASVSLARSVWDLLNESRFNSVRDQRFKGGHITRHYGRPQKGVHAVQLEIAQRAYMPESPPQWDQARSRGLIMLLKRLVSTLQEWQPDQPATS